VRSSPAGWGLAIARANLQDRIVRRVVAAAAVLLCAVAVVVAAPDGVVTSGSPGSSGGPVASSGAPDSLDDAGLIAPPDPLTLAVAAGRHWRLETPHGVVHVWTPAGYHADGAGLIAYVHGYYTDVDGAWRDYQLAEQWAMSGVNAMFVACEAPANNKAPVYWSSLSELLRTVQGGIGQPLPSGPVIAMGHSGAFRTLIPWLDDPRVDWVVMVDAAYGHLEPFEEWVKARPAHHLYFVGDDTIEWTEEMRRELPGTIEVDRFTFDGLPRDAHAARVVYVRSQFAHMPIVTGGIALPSLVRAMPLEALPDSPWAVQLGSLPAPDAGVPDGGGIDGGGMDAGP
jgi:hypothetical protein